MNRPVDPAIEVHFLRQENSHLRERIADMKASSLNTVIMRRENVALRQRQSWLEQRVNELEKQLGRKKQAVYA